MMRFSRLRRNASRAAGQAPHSGPARAQRAFRAPLAAEGA
jgi:hypothetical protein